MSLHLSAQDLTRLGAATEALLAPAPDGNPWAWWRGAEARLRELFPGSNVMLSMPEGERLRNDSDSIESRARQRISELTAVDRAGHFLIRDPAIEAWVAWRRTHRLEVWSTRENMRIIERLGFDGRDSVFVNEGLYAASLFELCGLSYESPAGEAFLQVGYPRGRASRFGDDVPLLTLLRPAYRAGHHAAFARAQREAALAATLDAAGEALLVVAPDGRALHRSAALSRLLAADPERERLLDALTRAARDVGAVRGGRASLAPGATQTVATAAARYAVRASYASELVWGAPGTVLVSVEAERALPTPDALPASLGLTRRETEVARLLAERFSNAQVAAALGVSEHTARHHTEKVLQKLGVSSRGEVAARLRTP